MKHLKVVSHMMESIGFFMAIASHRIHINPITLITIQRRFQCNRYNRMACKFFAVVQMFQKNVLRRARTWVFYNFGDVNEFQMNRDDQFKQSWNGKLSNYDSNSGGLNVISYYFVVPFCFIHSHLVAFDVYLEF